jgi:hypothetical protein
MDAQDYDTRSEAGSSDGSLNNEESGESGSWSISSILLSSLIIFFLWNVNCNFEESTVDLENMMLFEFHYIHDGIICRKLSAIMIIFQWINQTDFQKKTKNKKKNAILCEKQQFNKLWNFRHIELKTITVLYYMFLKKH